MTGTSESDPSPGPGFPDDAADMSQGGGDESITFDYHHHKYRDCIVFNYFYQRMAESGRNIDTSRAVFVPMGSADRYWPRSGVYRGSHIQICVRSTTSILSVWHVRRDGRYGLD